MHSSWICRLILDFHVSRVLVLITASKVVWNTWWICQAKPVHFLKLNLTSVCSWIIYIKSHRLPQMRYSACCKMPPEKQVLLGNKWGDTEVEDQYELFMFQQWYDQGTTCSCQMTELFVNQAVCVHDCARHSVCWSSRFLLMPSLSVFSLFPPCLCFDSKGQIYWATRVSMRSQFKKKKDGSAQFCGWSTDSTQSYENWHSLFFSIM